MTIQQQTLPNIKWRHSKGFILLISVLLIGAVAVAVTVSTLLLGTSTSRTGFALQQSKEAQGLADTCAEDALEHIRINNSYTGTSGLTLGNGTCTTTVTAGVGQARTITASGTVGTLIRRLTVQVSAITPDITVVSWQETQ